MIVYTGVILAISKHDESASMVYAREVDADFNGNGQPFQLANDQNGFTWQNEHLTAENLKFGSVVTYRKHDGNVYSNKVDCRPQVGELPKLNLDFCMKIVSRQTEYLEVFKAVIKVLLDNEVLLSEVKLHIVKNCFTVKILSAFRSLFRNDFH